MTLPIVDSAITKHDSSWQIHNKVPPRTYMHWTAVSERRIASGGVGCKGHERTRCTPHFRSTSHCDGDAKHRQDSCGEYNCLIQ